MTYTLGALLPGSLWVPLGWDWGGKRCRLATQPALKPPVTPFPATHSYTYRYPWPAPAGARSLRCWWVAALIAACVSHPSRAQPCASMFSTCTHVFLPLTRPVVCKCLGVSSNVGRVIGLTSSSCAQPGLKAPMRLRTPAPAGRVRRGRRQGGGRCIPHVHRAEHLVRARSRGSRQGGRWGGRAAVPVVLFAPQIAVPKQLHTLPHTAHTATHCHVCSGPCTLPTPPHPTPKPRPIPPHPTPPHPTKQGAQGRAARGVGQARGALAG